MNLFSQINELSYYLSHTAPPLSPHNLLGGQTKRKRAILFLWQNVMAVDNDELALKGGGCGDDAGDDDDASLSLLYFFLAFFASSQADRSLEEAATAVMLSPIPSSPIRRFKNSPQAPSKSRTWGAHDLVMCLCFSNYF